jgi:uncharacterized phage-like protein YoqJ
VCFTGHRNIAYEDAVRLPALLERVLIDLIERGATTFRAGGAMGFDTAAALKVLEFRETLPIRLVLCLPCRDQTRGWSEAGCRAYRYILDRADEIHYTSDRYTSTCMLERDRALVDGSDVCVAYCTRNRGGSFYTCSYAVKRDVELINLADLLKEKTT